jgi:diguanylate cyclase (GGDEF)-like protein
VTSMKWRIAAAAAGLVLWTALMQAQTPADKAADTSAAAHWEELAKRQELAGDYAGALISYKRFKEEHDRILVQNAAAGRWRLGRNLIGGAAVLLALIGFGVYRRRVEAERTTERVSVTDPLTGLKNRRYMVQTIGADIAAAQRKRRNAPDGVRATDSDLVCLLVDLDRFKSVNDDFGHKAGDAVLIQLADVLRESCRASDTIARWGGDEFLVLSRFTDRRTGSVIAERIRSAIEERAFDVGDDRLIHRTCSVGFASYPFSLTHEQALSWEQVVAVADEARRLAKRTGANTWAGVTANDAATAAQLQPRPVDTLQQWTADGIVVISTK